MLAMLHFALLAAQAAPMPQPSPTPAADRVICRSQKTTGSRLSSRRVCMTAAEWEGARTAARRRADAIQGGALTAPTG